MIGAPRRRAARPLPAAGRDRRAARPGAELRGDRLAADPRALRRAARVWPSPVVALNRAVALAMVDGPEAALAASTSSRPTAASPATATCRRPRPTCCTASAATPRPWRPTRAALALTDNAAEQAFIESRRTRPQARELRPAREPVGLDRARPSASSASRAAREPRPGRRRGRAAGPVRRSPGRWPVRARRRAPAPAASAGAWGCRVPAAPRRARP